MTTKTTTFFLVIMLVCWSSQTWALVNCRLVQSAIEKGQVEQAAALVEQQVSVLCAFYIAWAWQKTPEKAKPYIERIRDILNRREPFYYEALYLKLLLLDDMTANQRRESLDILKSVRPDLVEKFDPQSVQVNCDPITTLIEQGLMQDAEYLIDYDRKIPQLCAFHIAWALKKQPKKASPYIERIRDLLDHREPFYYKALYLKLLLLDDLNDREISHTFNKLMDKKPELAQQLKNEKQRQFQAQYQQLLQSPFEAQIVLKNPWVADDMPEKKQAIRILALRNEILRKDNFSSQSNSHQIIVTLQKLKRLGVQIDEKHKIWTKHQAYIRYSQHLAIAQNVNNKIVARFENAKQAFDIQKTYQFDDNHIIQNLLSNLQQQQKLITLEKPKVEPYANQLEIGDKFQELQKVSEEEKPKEMKIKHDRIIILLIILLFLVFIGGGYYLKKRAGIIFGIFLFFVYLGICYFLYDALGFPKTPNYASIYIALVFPFIVTLGIFFHKWGYKEIVSSVLSFGFSIAIYLVLYNWLDNELLLSSGLIGGIGLGSIGLWKIFQFLGSKIEA
ncbi:membrane protein [Beggiatoa sp. PS]|nr:membrane protein [Beggiatoa sp. PS]